MNKKNVTATLISRQLSLAESGLQAGWNIGLKSGSMTVLPLAAMAMLLTACGGAGVAGGSSSGNSQTAALRVGMQRQYSATSTETTVYANPTGTLQNSTVTSKSTISESVLQAPASTGASFDVHTVTNFAQQAAGSQPISSVTTSDAYENLVTQGGTQTVQTLSSTATNSYDDAYADSLGNGPYTATTTQNFSYATPSSKPVMPLQPGTSYSVSLASVITTSFKEVNKSGNAPPGGYGVAYSGVDTTNSDGSGSSTINWADGSNAHSLTNANGSSYYAYNSPTNAYTQTIGLPQLSNGVYMIPINVTHTVPTTSSTNYSVKDWYPGNGAAASGGTSKNTVVGPVASLPAACSAAVLQSNAIEVDGYSTSFSVTGFYTTSNSQAFSVNGVNVCTITKTTTMNYDFTTGVLFDTQTTQSARWLTSMSG